MPRIKPANRYPRRQPDHCIFKNGLIASGASTKSEGDQNQQEINHRSISNAKLGGTQTNDNRP
jgi:hypothetical protein